MFTGIVTDVGEVVAITPRAQGLLQQMKILCSYPVDTLVMGASIACAGVCHTVVGFGEEGDKTWFTVDSAAETLKLTTVGRWRNGARINLERSLKIGDELGGHLVLGHVDGVARVLEREDLPDTARFVFEAPSEVSKFIAMKGSVAIDGISLTVNEVDGDTFSVLIIPHTLEVTTLGQLQAGGEVNLEVDMMARYAARLTETRLAPQ